MRITWSRKHFLLLLPLLVIAVMTFWGWRSLQDLRSFKSNVDALQALASGDPAQVDYSQAADHAHALRDDMLALQRDANPALWLLPHLGWVPKVGAELQAAPDLLEMGLKLSEAGDLLLKAFSPVLEAGMGSPDLIETAGTALLQAGPQFAEAGRLIEDATLARERIDAQALSPHLQPYLRKLDRTLPLAQLALDAGQVAPAMLGLHGPQAFLVVAQNNDELRGTGGFITAAGCMLMYDGAVADLSFMDSYAVDDLSKYYPDPPQALYDTMLAEQWLFRDSNWSPDFPTAAQEMASSYEYGTGQPVEGVIALDMHAMQLLVDAIGPLSIEGEDVLLTGSNVVDWMRAARGGLGQGEGLGDWWAGRKDFMELLSDAAKQRMASGQIDWLALGGAGLQAVEEKHLQFYFSDEEAQSILQAQGWDGALASTQGDTWMLVDSNVGFNKADMLIEREVRYQIELQPDGSAHSVLEVQYENQAPATDEPCDPTPRYSKTYLGEAQRCYWDYLRVYLPQELDLLEAPSAPQPEISLPAQKLDLGGVDTFTLAPGDGDRQVAAWSFLVPRGETYCEKIVYQLPSGTVQQIDGRWRYQLVIQKQPGSLLEMVEVVIQLPQGAQIHRSDPAPGGTNGGSFTYVFQLDQDQRLLLEYSLDE